MVSRMWKTNMIIKHTYDKEETEKIKEYLKELKQAQWIGEDGEAVCVANSEKGALTKFKRLMRDDVGEVEARDIKLEDVGIGYLLLPTKEELKNGSVDPDWEWYVNWSGKRVSDYPVWILQT